jgi:hypothetical protein
MSELVCIPNTNGHASNPKKPPLCCHKTTDFMTIPHKINNNFPQQLGPAMGPKDCGILPENSSRYRAPPNARRLVCRHIVRVDNQTIRAMEATYIVWSCSQEVQQWTTRQGVSKFLLKATLGCHRASPNQAIRSSEKLDCAV